MPNRLGVIQWANGLTRCSECGLKKLCFAKNLTSEEIIALEDIVASNCSYERGDYLYHLGDYLSDLVIIKSGSAKTELISKSGNVQIVSFHFPGDLLGLDSLTSPQMLSSVIFLESASVCNIPMHSFNQLSTRAPQLHQNMVNRLSNEIANDHELILSMNNHSAEQRLAVFLLDMSHRQKNRGLSAVSLYLSMARNDIANYLGLASATVSRTLSKFEREGIITVENRHLVISGYQALSDFITNCEECESICVTE